MSTPAKRINSLINALNLNINSFSKECGYPTSATIWRLINEGAKPSAPTLDKICNRFTQVNREWLMTGFGNMFSKTKESSDDLTLTANQVLNEVQPQLDVINKRLDIISSSLLGLEIYQGADMVEEIMYRKKKKL